jgi:hypothetical protein
LDGVIYPMNCTDGRKNKNVKHFLNLKTNTLKQKY